MDPVNVARQQINQIPVKGRYKVVIFAIGEI